MNGETSQLFAVSGELTYWSKLFFKIVSKIEKGKLTIITPEKQTVSYEGDIEGEDVIVTIKDWKFTENLFLKGDIGLGESYIEGHWESSNINGLIKLGIDNYDILKSVIKGQIFKVLMYRFKHLFLNRNTKAGSKRNIYAHYDIGNRFYKLWLDPSMTYSAALFDGEDISLEEAQKNKYQHILDELPLKEGDHILEVGCGWGGFMEYAAKRNYKVTGVTISQEQYDYAVERLAEYGDLCEVKLQDYRDIDGHYDHIVSIEMFEALGQAYWKGYFKKLYSILRPGGHAVIQSITINNKDFKSYSRGSDFIQQFIFPGGMLPSPKEVEKQSRKSGLRLLVEYEFGADYAKTLDQWEINFSRALDKVREYGLDDKFIRTWRFYLKYCQGGFEARKISVSQFNFVKRGKV
ncbi:class I SAM-dependent methyltransferase [Halobacteriovorax sp.]|uniref:class I SAM-dependent methyltransferase n=1 Tax=Halobacteriovorax sp. TaxID=2020862 RepID=UPI00356AE494